MYAPSPEFQDLAPNPNLPLPRRAAPPSADPAAAQKHQVEAHAHEELNRSPYASMQRVSCTYEQGVLVLHGRVPSYFLKQMAQHILLARLDVNVRIDNRLEVSAARA